MSRTQVNGPMATRRTGRDRGEEATGDGGATRRKRHAGRRAAVRRMRRTFFICFALFFSCLMWKKGDQNPPERESTLISFNSIMSSRTPIEAAPAAPLAAGDGATQAIVRRAIDSNRHVGCE